VQWERALTLSTNHAAIYNNLANHYGHNGPVEKAFTYYEKAIALDTNEPVYLHNFATTVFLFRKHVREHYGITEDQVFDKAMDLYARAMRLDPRNFPLATDVARCYYGIKPLRIADAKAAWQKALQLAGDDVEREGVYLHLARWEIFDQKWDAAHAWLNKVTNAMYLDTRTTVLKNLENRRQQAATNAPPTKLAP
jgi:tetratricopeptide (TPR) repeat protein